jgi:hypothetical protein
MKKIYLKGVLETLSEMELKKVVGGIEPAKFKEAPKEPPTLGEAACNNHLPWSNCKMQGSRGDLNGQCLYRGDKLTCVITA